MLLLGQKVKVVENISHHYFDIGEEVKVCGINNVDENGYILSFSATNEVDTWYLEEDEVEKLED